MSVAIEVPFNTMLADLDVALRTLLKGELASHGFNGVEIAFDAPSREWSAGVSKPTLNLFLYDLREAAHGPAADVTEHRGNGSARVERPPLRVDCAYSITAWTRAVQDEHRMLSQTLAVLLAYERLPAAALGEALAEQGPGISTRIGRPKVEGASEFWTALGGQYKLSLDYVVTLACDPGVTFHRGPEVHTHSVRVTDRDGAPRGRTTELHRAAGTVTGVDGLPVEGAWLALPGAGAFATSDENGRFSFSRVPPGRHRCECRAPDGALAHGELAVPGEPLELRISAG
jgi:hypothetical protein